VIVPPQIRDELIAHARAEAPNEACGLVTFRDGVAERYLPGHNRVASPYRFELEPGSPDDWFVEDDGFELAVFHSHPSSAPRPSRTDIENIGLWAGRPYLILSPRTGELTAWTIRDGKAEHLGLT
jgi:[CysO sulfur-carrier protein]-S-L-cysteine hydrolase